MRRKREIEDLEELLVKAMIELLEEADAKHASREDADRWAIAEAPRTMSLARINDLIERHNRYYPWEANLPMEPRTGRLLERGGRPWSKMNAVSFDGLAASARERM